MPNLQEDIMCIYPSGGVLCAQYTYDSWGNVVSVKDQNGNSVTSANIGQVNPIRYRGYYQDLDTGMYYLQSRYYDPQVGRVINADSVAGNVGNSTFNLFVYCANNPIMYSDPSGQCPEGMIGPCPDIWGRQHHEATKRAAQRQKDLDKIIGSNSLPKKGDPGSNKTLPNPDGTPKQKRWYGPDGDAERDRDYNHPGDMPFPHDHEWKDGIRQPEHLPPDPSYEFRWEPVIGAGLVIVCVAGIIVVAADDATGIGVADDFLFGPLGAGVGKGLIMITG